MGVAPPRRRRRHRPLDPRRHGRRRRRHRPRRGEAGAGADHRPRHGRDPPRRRRLRPRRRGRRRARRPPPDGRASDRVSDGAVANGRVAMRIEGDFGRDGAVCVRGAFAASTSSWPGGDRRQPRRPLAARQAGEQRRRRRVRRGLLQLAAAPGDRAVRPGVRRRRHRRRADGRRHGPAVPRPRAGQGARHPPAHAVAPGPAVLQRRRPAERQHVVPRRSGAPRVDAGVRRRLAPRRVVHAALVPRRPGEVVPGRHARRAARRRRRPDEFRVIGWELEPGDAVFFHMLTLHAAGGVPGTTAGACCRCASSATTSCTPRARGPRRRRSPGSPTSCRRACRWTTRCSRSCGRRHDGPQDRHRRPSRAAPARPRGDARRAGRAPRCSD